MGGTTLGAIAMAESDYRNLSGRIIQAFTDDSHQWVLCPRSLLGLLNENSCRIPCLLVAEPPVLHSRSGFSGRMRMS